MLIWTAKFSKKKAAGAVVLMGAVMAALIVLMGRTPSEEPPSQPKLTSNEERVSYLQTLGWSVEPEPVETLQFLLPDPLEGTYLTYNALQKEQGFDLTSCCGRQVFRYTYAVTNYPGRPQGVQANLYLCEEQPVAGDVFCAGAGGFQRTLAFPTEESNG